MKIKCNECGKEVRIKKEEMQEGLKFVCWECTIIPPENKGYFIKKENHNG